jgi:hypothetical protein
MNYTIHTKGMNHTVHTKGQSEIVILVELVVLVHLVLLVVVFIFFSLFLQLVLLQRIVDIYVDALSRKFFAPTDDGTTTWRLCVSEAHFLMVRSSP